MLESHFGVEIPISVVRTELTLDILNLSNLINSDWGQIKYAAFNEISPIRHRGFDDSGRPIYELLFTDPDDSDASVEADLPDDIWERLSKLLLGDILGIPSIRAEAERLGARR